MYRLSQQLIDLGYEQPELRPHLREILAVLQRLDRVKGEPGKMREILRIREDETIEDRYSPKSAVSTLIRVVGKSEAASMINYVANFTEKDFFVRMQRELERRK